MAHNFFEKKAASGGAFESEIIPKQELAEELLKSIVRKLKKQKAQSFFIDNIWDTDLLIIRIIQTHINHVLKKTSPSYLAAT